MDILEIAKEIEFNAKAEAQAVYDYTELLKKLAESEIDEEQKEIALKNISEIIADELNHQGKLKELYSYFTDIMANKD